MRLATTIPGTAILVAILSCWPLAAADGIEAGLAARETLLARLPAGTSQMVVSPDGRRVAYVVRKGGQSSVVVDGRAQERYDAVRGLVFSPDSRRLAFAAKRQGKWRIVADGIGSRAYADVSVPRFSPDGTRVVFEASRGAAIGVSTPWWEQEKGRGRAGSYRVVVNGVPGRAYDWIGYGGLAFVEGRAAYQARRGRKLVMAVKGREGVPCDWLWGPYATADGRGVAYAGSRREEAGLRFSVVVNGVTRGGYSFIAKRFFAFSADSRHYAYLAYRGDELVVVVDGREQPVGQRAQENFPGLALSANGKHLAYSLPRSIGGPWAVTLDGREGKDYPGIAFKSLTFSPDGSRFAYAAEVEGGWLVVADGEEGKRYNAIEADSLLFSRDSGHLAYIAGGAGGQFVVVDGAEGSAYDSIVKGSLVYSPDSEHLAYVALRDGRRFVVLDGKRGSDYEEILGPLFSPDGRHLAYAASAGGDAVIVVDEVPVTLERSTFPSFARLAFDSRSHLHTLAQRGHDLLRVEVEIAQQ